MKLLIRSTEVKPKTKILVWGASGVGKTHFGLSAPNPLVIDTERGCEAFFNRYEFDLLALPTVDQIDLAVRKLEEGDHNYKTLAIDSLTGVCELYAEKYSRGDKATFNDWGMIKPKLDKLMKRLVALPLNLIFTARSQNIFNKEYKIVGQRPHIFKGLAYWFDIVGRLDRKGSGAPMMTLNKTRFALPQRIEDISFERLQSLIYNEVAINSGNGNKG